MVFESQLSRRNCQTFSTGFSSGHLGGSGSNVISEQIREKWEPVFPPDLRRIKELKRFAFDPVHRIKRKAQYSERR